MCAPVSAAATTACLRWSPLPGLNWRPRPYQGRALPTELSGPRPLSSVPHWSGKRDSNPRHSAWKADALPTELFPRSARSERPLSSRRSRHFQWRGVDLNHRRRVPADLQSAPFGRSGTPPESPLQPSHPNARPWSWRWDSNPRPAAYKAAALPAELRQQDFSEKRERVDARAPTLQTSWSRVLYGMPGPLSSRQKRPRDRQLAATLTRRFIERDGSRGRHREAVQIPHHGDLRRQVARPADERAEPLPFAAEHERGRAAQVERGEWPVPVRREGDRPDARLLEPLEALRDVRHPGEGDLLDRARRGLRD